MKKKALLGLVTVAGLTLTLAACGGNSSKGTSSSSDSATADTGDFKLKTTNKKEAVKGGTLEIAEVSDTAFTGIFNDAFSEMALDTTFFGPANESLFTYDKDLKIKDGAAKVKFDEAAKSVTITLRDDLKWSDGKDVTADDLVFPYEVIGDKDYTGVRYDSSMKNIIGMEDYHDGKADSISGIKKDNDKQITISYKEFTPSILQGGGGVWSSAMPKHAFEGIAVKDMPASDPVRKNPITFGPYVVSKITAGESVEFTPNKYYYGGTPKLSKIIMKTLPTSSATASMKSKEFDIYDGMPNSEYTSWKDLGGYELLGQQDTAYNYIGFKLGKWDDTKKVNVTDSNAKMADKSLRQAIGYAIDNEAIAQKLYNGLQTRANSLIVPAFGTKYDKDLKGYTQDVKKAKKLLDDAGYKDTDGDGYREDKNGKKLEINFAFRDGGTTAKSLAEYYIQAWKEVGLDVKLATGRLIEVNSFYDKIQNDDPSIDMYQAGWSTGFDPDQSGLYGEDAKFNFTRFVSDENTKLIKEMQSKDAFDDAKAAKIYQNWQEYANEEAFVIPTTYTFVVTPVSDRVTGYDISRDLDYNVYAKVGVTSDKR
jgi:peptide/nickel transport system substrate-binding protein